jgi:hypothetical protein
MIIQSSLFPSPPTVFAGSNSSSFLGWSSLVMAFRCLHHVSAALMGFDVTLERPLPAGANRWTPGSPSPDPPGDLTGAFAFIISFDELIITMFISGTPHLPSGCGWTSG